MSLFETNPNAHLPGIIEYATAPGTGTVDALVAIGGISPLSEVDPASVTALNERLTELMGNGSATTQAVQEVLAIVPDDALAPVVVNVCWLRSRELKDPSKDALLIAAGQVASRAVSLNGALCLNPSLAERYRNSRLIMQRVIMARDDLTIFRSACELATAPTGAYYMWLRSRPYVRERGAEIAAMLEDTVIIEPGIAENWGRIGKPAITLADARDRATAIGDMLLWASRIDQSHSLDLHRALLDAQHAGHVVENSPRIFPDGRLPRYVRRIRGLVEKRFGSDPLVGAAAAYHSLGLIALARCV